MSVAIPLHEIRAEFAELDDPVDRTTYLIEIGRTLPPLDEHLKTEENRVLGCQARVADGDVEAEITRESRQAFYDEHPDERPAKAG